MKKITRLLQLLVFIIVTNAYSQYDDFFGSDSKRDYICYYLINSEIKHSMAENERQKDMQDRQLTNLAMEKANRSQWEHYKEKMDKIQKRLNSASLAIQSLPSAYKITKEITAIHTLQQKIYDELYSSPFDVMYVMAGQTEFVKKANETLLLMAGIVLSYGTINQMERAERKILLDFVAQEFKSIRINSYTTLTTLRNMKARKKYNNNLFKNWVQKDKVLIKQIIQNANNL